MVEKEEWRAVEDYPHYEVSDRGRVRSYFKRGKYGGTVSAPKLRSTFHNQGGYCRIRLYKNGRGGTKYVAREVAAAFLGPCPDGCQVNHIDGHKDNNHVENLEYVSPSQNMFHAYSLGLFPPVDRSGELNGRSKLTSTQVLEIRRLLAAGAKCNRLGEKYNVDEVTISKIKHRKLWRHI